jgi:uncharacterized protein (TIRG00374 family)
LFVLLLALTVYYFSEIKKEWRLLEKVNPYWLIAALCGQFLTYFFSALIYRFLLGAYRLTRSPGKWDLLKASIISLFFNQTVPSAGISGNTFFLNFLGKFNISRPQAISLILEELLIFYTAMESIIVSLLIACMLIYRSFYSFKGTLTAGAIVYLAFGLAIVLAGRKNVLNRVYAKVEKIGFLKKWVKSMTKELNDNEVPGNGMHLWIRMRNNRPIVTKAFLFQLLVPAADGFTLYALFWGLGHPVSPFIVLITLICTKIISLLPLLPGSLVIYESSMSLFFVNAGIPAGTAVIVTLIYRLLSFWLPMPVGTLLYRKWLKNNK